MRRNFLSGFTPSLRYAVMPSSAGTHEVQGQRASKNEYNVAVALEKVTLDFIFQYEVYYGRRMGRGFIIDFLIFTQPLPTPLWVNGEYWHRGEQREIDFYQETLFNAISRGTFMPAVTLWGMETDTPELALQAVRRVFNL